MNLYLLQIVQSVLRPTGKFRHDWINQGFARALIQRVAATMALKITLKPNEKMIVSGAVVTNGNNKNTDLIIENNVPVLRQKDILSEEDATSPCRRIYFIIQLMYIDEGNLTDHQPIYWKLVHELLDAVPRLAEPINQINENILAGNFYRALKLAGQLIDYEQEVLKHVREYADSIA